MELLVEPTEIPGRWTWTVIYDGTAGRQVRPYFLVEQDAAKGTFVIDEGNALPERYRGVLFGVAPLLNHVVMSAVTRDGSSVRTHDIGQAVTTAPSDLAGWPSPARASPPRARG